INPFAKRMFKMLTLSNFYTNDILKLFSDKFTGVDVKASFEKSKETNFYEIPEIDSENKIYKVKFTLINNEKDKKYSLIWIEDITESKILERKKSEFVSVVAHQLRTPLSGIKWTLKMLLTGDLGVLTDDQKSFVGKAYDSNDRMISLINDMLNVDRIVSGRLQYFFVNIQFLDLVESVIYELMPFANKRKVTISFKEKPAILAPIFIDPEKMRAVVQNLIENAIKYTKAEGSIRVILTEKSDTIYFEVQDNGIGVPPAEQTNIFTRFFRSTNAVRVQTDGSGLGLFISKSIIETHHGTIGFKSELGKGSSFYFEIPKQFKNNVTTNNNVVSK
ncbi:MAG: HAMP domain-containing sensor histidine kinase, partial [bacterium]|nr:HAMP domain-containing sensor histidine kinase [bacterium]